MGKQWDKIFRKYGKFFTKPQEDIPKIVKYANKSSGKIGSFSGTEKIFYKGKEIYRLKYQGGFIKN